MTIPRKSMIMSESVPDVHSFWKVENLTEDLQSTVNQNKAYFN